MTTAVAATEVVTTTDEADTVSPSAKDLILSFADDYIKSRLSQSVIAKQVGCTQTYVSHILRSLTKKRNELVHTQRHRAIIEHIKECGGGPKETARQLGIVFNSSKFYQYIREHNINIKDFQFANLEFGSWLVVAGPWTKKGTNYFVTALCRQCATIYSNVSLTNLRSGRSSCCIKCHGGRFKVKMKVKCSTTGEEYSSIRTFCEELGMIQQYQTMRMKIKRLGSVFIDGMEYELINS